MRTAKNKLSRKKKNKRPPLGYLPINPQRSASFDNSRNSNNSTLNVRPVSRSSLTLIQTSGNDESLNIPSTPEKNGLKPSKSENDTSLSSIKVLKFLFNDSNTLNRRDPKRQNWRRKRSKS